MDRDTPDLHCTPERTIVDLQGDGPLVSLGRYRYLTARDPLPAQRHASLLVLAFPLRSDVTFSLEGHRTNVAPGTAVVIRPDTVYLIDGRAQPRGSLLWLVTRISAADRSAGPLEQAVRQLAGGPDRTWPVPGSVVDVLGRALDDPYDQRWPVLAMRRALCATAVFEVLLARAGRPVRPAPVVPPGIRRALAYVDAQIDRPLAVHELISASGLSPSHFYDAFALAVGTSPKDYVLRRKIARAARALLAEPTQNITDVGHHLGFSSSQHFAEVFRRYQGMSPSEYRRATDARRRADPDR